MADTDAFLTMKLEATCESCGQIDAMDHDQSAAVIRAAVRSGHVADLGAWPLPCPGCNELLSITTVVI